MTLQNNLFTIAERSDNQFLIQLNKDCFIYKAHFPEQPVTPGVCIIGTATELLESRLGVRLSVKEVINAKFLAVINPTDTPVVTYTFTKTAKDDEASEVKTSVTVTAGTTVFAKLSLLYSIDASARH